MAQPNWITRILSADATTGQRYPFFADDEVSEVMKTWQSYGHPVDQMQRRSDGIWITTPGSLALLQVERNRIVIHKNDLDAGIFAALLHAQKQWPNGIDIQGSEEFKLKAWAHAQAAGVRVGNYSPPPHLMAEARVMLGGIYTMHANQRIFGHNPFDEGDINGGPRMPTAWAYSPPAPPFKVDAMGFPLRPGAPQSAPAHVPDGPR